MMTISIDNNFTIDQASRDHLVTANTHHWSIGVGLFFTCGLGAMILGLVLAGEFYLGLVVESDRVANVSVFMLMVSLPLLLLGAHGMDKMAARKREEREASLCPRPARRL